ncbi:hypothetical protein ABIB25_003147 [Nakamurella sp. UYEF19]|uniref:DUF222 domain-containing protein n=1 Tax=Nakamurella sp. UYEF19 TaxID=1756392 RepID=UPI0033918066
MTTVPVDPDSAAAPSGPPAAPTPEPAAAPAAVPVADTFEWVTSAVPAALSPSELPDLIVAANRLISHLQAVQIAAVAEFATPGRCGSMTKLIDGLIDHTGLANRPGGLVDPEAMSVLIAERAQDMAAAEISAALHQSPLGAAHRVSAAVELVQELPATLEVLKAGRIDLPRARMIAERTANLDPTLRTAVEAKVLPLAETRTPGLLRPMIDLRVILADPTASKKRADKARKDRFVDHTPSVDGMGMIRAHLTAEGAVAVFDLLDRIAKATVGMDERGIAACRADALVDMCLQILANGFVDLRDTCTPDNAETAPAETTTDTDILDKTSAAERAEDSADLPVESVEGDETADGTVAAASVEVAVPPDPTVSVAPQPITARPGKRLSKITKHHGRGAHFNLTMSLAAFTEFNQDPAELTGHGFLPAHLALAMKTSIRTLAVIVVNEHGHAMAVGSTAPVPTYIPTQTVTDQVLTAAGTCRFPSCRIPGPLCDLDHREPFDHQHPEQGGQTDAKSLDPLSRHHHFLKTFTDWTASRSPTMD